jgi:hypothetical protein
MSRLLAVAAIAATSYLLLLAGLSVLIRREVKGLDARGRHDRNVREQSVTITRTETVTITARAWGGQIEQGPVVADVLAAWRPREIGSGS